MRILCCFILLVLSTVARADLIQVGEGTARWGVFKIYDAAFFTEANLTVQQALADNTPARLELCYARALSVENFIEGAKLGLPPVVSVELEQAVQRLHAAYQPVKQGDCYGMIKFGSSTELVMPKTVDILVKKGDMVKGGITIIGRQAN